MERLSFALPTHTYNIDEIKWKWIHQKAELHTGYDFYRTMPKERQIKENQRWKEMNTEKNIHVKPFSHNFSLAYWVSVFFAMLFTIRRLRLILVFYIYTTCYVVGTLLTENCHIFVCIPTKWNWKINQIVQIYLWIFNYLKFSVCCAWHIKERLMIKGHPVDKVKLMFFYYACDTGRKKTEIHTV